MKFTTDSILVFPLDRMPKLGYYAGGRRREYVQRQISAQINSWCVVQFSSNMFLAKSYFGKSVILRT